MWFAFAYGCTGLVQKSATLGRNELHPSVLDHTTTISDIRDTFAVKFLAQGRSKNDQSIQQTGEVGLYQEMCSDDQTCKDQFSDTVSMISV
jgi:hypothetical protein